MSDRLTIEMIRAAARHAHDAAERAPVVIGVDLGAGPDITALMARLRDEMSVGFITLPTSRELSADCVLARIRGATVNMAPLLNAAAIRLRQLNGRIYRELIPFEEFYLPAPQRLFDRRKHYRPKPWRSWRGSQPSTRKLMRRR